MRSSLNILIVDDDHAMAQMCAKLIRRHGHSAIVAPSSQDALKIVKTSGVDAVISDIQMPQMTGVELLAQLREFDLNLPVILMTGYADIITPAEAKAMGAVDYLSKPFNAETLIDSVERSLPPRIRAAV